MLVLIGVFRIRKLSTIFVSVSSKALVSGGVQPNNWLQAQSLRSLDKFFHYGFASVPKFAPEPKRWVAG